MRADDPNLPYPRRIAEALGELREQVVKRTVAVETNLTKFGARIVQHFGD